MTNIDTKKIEELIEACLQTVEAIKEANEAQEILDEAKEQKEKAYRNLHMVQRELSRSTEKPEQALVMPYKGEFYAIYSNADGEFFADKVKFIQGK